ncbi:MAG: hypothetical protein EZS28_023495 [Streblomastix strix]|uniref:Uncharacterized protein n=1 Tax=Streblomastix strix TaxID=222440 RepID=A0A5J4VEF5_9EUKA|nr:MAG: hypothetical protein EZS28_023495 [Streblomastix strix]
MFQVVVGYIIEEEEIFKQALLQDQAVLDGMSTEGYDGYKVFGIQGGYGGQILGYQLAGQYGYYEDGIEGYQAPGLLGYQGVEQGGEPAYGVEGRGC